MLSVSLALLTVAVHADMAAGSSSELYYSLILICCLLAFVTGACMAYDRDNGAVMVCGFVL